MKIPITATLHIIANILLLVFGFTMFNLMNRSVGELFRENDLGINRQTAELIGRSARQSVLTSDYVGVRRIFQNAMRDPSIRMIRLIPTDGTEGLCVDSDQSCYSDRARGGDTIKHQLYFGQAGGELLGTVLVRFESLNASKLTSIISGHIGIAMILLFAFFNLILAVLFREMRKQVSWSIAAVRSLTKGQPAPSKKPILVEKEEFSRALVELQKVLEDYRSAIQKSSRQEAVIEVARQVAHDILSPLAALGVAQSELSALPEKRRIMIRSAIQRIKDIANHLLGQSQTGSENEPSTGFGPPHPKVVPTLLSTLIDAILTEKRLQFRARDGVRIHGEMGEQAYGLFAAVDANEFKRVLSNLINNGVEAIGTDPGEVRVDLYTQDSWVHVDVKDNGKGIAATILPTLGQRGQTHDKAGGMGLGLYHARTSAEAWGSKLVISSKIGKGSTFTLVLPQAPAPEWFVGTLEIAAQSTVVVLDDDVSIHQVWQGRFDSMRIVEHGIEILHMSTPAELRTWAGQNPGKTQRGLLLTDYELLGHKETGLDLVEELNLGERSILITSRFGEKEIFERSRRLKMRMIPKSLAALVPIRCKSHLIAPTNPGFLAGESVGNHELCRLDAVLIDDDEIARMAWEESAAKHGKTFSGFSSMEEFLNAASTISRQTPVYVDVKLGNGVRGDDESLRIHGLGFTEIYLATGHNPAEFAGLKHLRGVIGKEPPWAKCSDDL